MIILKCISIKTANAIKVTLSRIANEVLNGELDCKKASTIGYLCMISLSAIRTADQAEKLAELEKLVLELKESRNS